MSIILSFKRTFKQFTEFLKKYPENFGKIILTLYEAFICFTKQNNLHIFFYYDNKTFGIFQFPTDFLVKIKSGKTFPDFVDYLFWRLNTTFFSKVSFAASRLSTLDRSIINSSPEIL